MATDTRADDRSVAGDDLGARLRDGEGPIGCLDVAIDAAARAEVDVRIAVREERVAHVQHVRLLEVDDGVAVRVRRIDMDDLEIVAVYMERDRVGERDDRKRRLRGRRNLPVHDRLELLGGEPLAHVLVGDDDRAVAAEDGVAARVVAVPVRIEDEAHRLRRHRRDGLLQLRRHGRDLIVDEEHAGIADGERDVSARAGDEVEALGQLLRLELLGRLLCPRHGERQDDRADGNASNFHRGIMP